MSGARASARARPARFCIPPEISDGILRIRLDRPERRNAINDTMMDGLIAAVDTAGRDEDVRAIHISGSGDHFCGGADAGVMFVGGATSPDRSNDA